MAKGSENKRAEKKEKGKKKIRNGASKKSKFWLVPNLQENQPFC